MQKKLNKVDKFSKTNISYIFLLGLLVCLPALEALKNIFAFLFVISWLLISNKNNNWGGKWRVIDSIFLIWILVDILVSINAIIMHQFSGSNFRDVLRFVLISWVISRTCYEESRLIQLGIFSIIATCISLIHAYYFGNGDLKELYSVGHINHTAIFLVISYTIAISLLLSDYKNLKNYQKIILILAAIALFFATIDTGSRAAFGAIIVITLGNLFFIVLREKSLYLSLGVLVIVGIIGWGFATNPPHSLERILEREHVLKDDVRYRIGKFSYYVFKTNPWLGIGFGNFGILDESYIKEEVLKNDIVFDPNDYQRSAHTHNVYLNYLVSGGLVLFSVFIWFWFYIFWVIYKLRKNREHQWLVISSLGIVFINLFIGFFNTTLHHEHAILTMFILGLLISKYRLSQNKIEIV